MLVKELVGYFIFWMFFRVFREMGFEVVVCVRIFWGVVENVGCRVRFLGIVVLRRCGVGFRICIFNRFFGEFDVCGDLGGGF